MQSTPSLPLRFGGCPSGIRCTPCCACCWRMCPCCNAVAPPYHPHTSCQRGMARSWSGCRMRARRQEGTCPRRTRRGSARSSRADIGSQGRTRCTPWIACRAGTSLHRTACMMRSSSWPQTCPGYTALDPLHHYRKQCRLDTRRTERPSSGQSCYRDCQPGTAAPRASPLGSTHRARKALAPPSPGRRCGPRGTVLSTTGSTALWWWSRYRTVPRCMRLGNRRTTLPPAASGGPGRVS